MQKEEGKLTIADKKELDRSIKDLEDEIKKIDEKWGSGLAPGVWLKIKELRRLRRMRTQ